MLGDFNGDGTPDLAVGTDLPGESSRYVSVVLAKGNGFFNGPVRSLVEPRSQPRAVGDFNGDHKLDLVTANEDGHISLLLGKGDGTLQSPVDYATGQGAGSVAVSDFNGDGKLDLAVANPYDPFRGRYTNSGISVLLGNGDGTFQSAVSYAAAHSVSVAAGDLNGDGKPDLTVANVDSAYAQNRGLIVLFGKGDGTFQPAVSFDLGFRAQPFSVAMGDFNGDAKLDVVLGNNDLDSYDPTTARFTNSNVLVFLGKGDGTFQTPSSFKVFYSPYSIAVGDLNGDGRLDLITAGSRGVAYDVLSGTSILLGNGDGSFRAATSFPAWTVPSVLMGDFNGDGKLDFATVSSDDAIGAAATVWLNTSCFPLPALSVAHASASLTVFWPFPSVGYVLESTTNLNPASWSLFDPLPANRDGRWEATLPAADSQRYFRLRKP